MTTLTTTEQKLILNRLAFKITNNEINSFNDLNQSLNRFDLKINAIQPQETYYSSLLKDLKLRRESICNN
jgi:hypothetical protein